MRVIKAGKLPGSTYRFRGTCPHCGCVVEVEGLPVCEKCPTEGCHSSIVVNELVLNLRRTKSEVLALRSTVRGCCNRHADNQACDCLAQAREG